MKLALEIIEEDGPARGLLLNRNKSLLFAPPGDAPLSSEFPSDIPVARAGVSLLGSPVGSDDFCVTVVKDRLDSVRALLDRLPDIEDSQIEYSLLHSCLSLPKFISILRTCSPSIISSLTIEFDQIIYSSLSRILGACPSPLAWSKATLLVALGGLGLRQAQIHAPAPFLGAICSVRSLVDDMCHESFPPSYNPLLSLSSILWWAILIGHPLKTWTLSYVRKPCLRLLTSSLINPCSLLHLMIGPGLWLWLLQSPILVIGCRFSPLMCYIFSSLIWSSGFVISIGLVYQWPVLLMIIPSVRGYAILWETMQWAAEEIVTELYVTMLFVRSSFPLLRLLVWLPVKRFLL